MNYYFAKKCYHSRNLLSWLLWHPVLGYLVQGSATLQALKVRTNISGEMMKWCESQSIEHEGYRSGDNKLLVPDSTPSFPDNLGEWMWDQLSWRSPQQQVATQHFTALKFSTFDLGIDGERPYSAQKQCPVPVTGVSHHVTFRLQALSSLDIPRSLERFTCSWSTG